MAARQGIGKDPKGLTGLHPQPRFAAVTGLSGSGATMELARLLAVPLMTIDGLPRVGRDVVTQRTVLILIDAYRAIPERSAAEVGWVQERLESGIDLVLIWPGRALEHAMAMPVSSETRMYLDVQGAFRRLVSPTGRRVAVLADPESGELELVTGDSPVFSVRRSPSSSDDRGSDGAIDLGDVYR